MKIIRFLIMLVTLLLLTSCSNDEHYQSNDILKFNDYIESVSWGNDYNLYPDIESLPDGFVTKINYVERTGSFIRSKTLILEISIPEGDYQNFKEDLLANYTFLSESIKNNNGDEIISEVDFEYGSYRIYIVENDDYDYPKNFGMVGYSDTNHKIIILLFSDDDLDIITDMASILEDDFLLTE